MERKRKKIKTFYIGMDECLWALIIPHIFIINHILLAGLN